MSPQWRKAWKFAAEYTVAMVIGLSLVAIALWWFGVRP